VDIGVVEEGSSVFRPVQPQFALYELMTHHKTILTTSSYQLIAPGVLSYC